ncbi:hypothetical protein PIB30_018793 [Stylosanthes scabra]|uniref:Sulfotransferase n=1 Tax=Stylosanthes scabra TaxID=79078 RepID=A0ABU6R8A8_9FABA|nr:hypothetical protein [Stylosanthes scabra]
MKGSNNNNNNNKKKKKKKKVMFIKYEEIKMNPTLVLKELAEFLGFPFSREEEDLGVVDEILKLCSFDNLSNLEVNNNGKMSFGVKTKLFFRLGQVGDSKNYLTLEMIENSLSFPSSYGYGGVVFVNSINVMNSSRFDQISSKFSNVRVEISYDDPMNPSSKPFPPNPDVKSYYDEIPRTQACVLILWRKLVIFIVLTKVLKTGAVIEPFELPVRGFKGSTDLTGDRKSVGFQFGPTDRFLAGLELIALPK